MNDIVVPHDPRWEAAFLAEAQVIRPIMGRNLLALHHIGSTSIPDILAKPIIDIMGEVTSLDETDACSAGMARLGYEVMGAYGMKDRRYFRKMDARGVRTHHVHIFPSTSEHVERHLAFRDFLLAHPEKAQEYSCLKAALVAGESTSWDDYLNGKAPFIESTEVEAIAWYRTNRKGKS